MKPKLQLPLLLLAFTLLLLGALFRVLHWAGASWLLLASLAAVLLAAIPAVLRLLRTPK